MLFLIANGLDPLYAPPPLVWYCWRWVTVLDCVVSSGSSIYWCCWDVCIRCCIGWWISPF